ncbi:uncharacterized protein PFL1_04263 [Pseudozyma flocculosa PF-1]|uniref:Uncharacterized protein n=1 Tax=Pseudozyma flocculosa PF-1 TaxID=1277687 RepID=A0A061H692_9BASI|nr:uncharacterized protein PFL1_04263 [Pseudozyma flocculosa PF-1]EPQ28437.1 hypothetical protein PFL1_04263 [Pseudozyma flocculosa PF-1]
MSIRAPARPALWATVLRGSLSVSPHRQPSSRPLSSLRIPSAPPTPQRLVAHSSPGSSLDASERSRLQLPLAKDGGQRYRLIRSFFAGVARSHQPRSAASHLGIRWHGGLTAVGPAASSVRCFSSSSTSAEEGRSDKSKHDATDGVVKGQEELDSSSDPRSAAAPARDRPPADREPAEARGEGQDHELTTTDRAYKHFQNYPRSLRELAMRAIPHVPAGQGSKTGDEQGSHGQHPSSWTRPQKEDLLRIAHGFWTRMRIRFKWFTIRGFRRFNADDISAFFTLGGVTTIFFVIVGTTTFFSLIFAALNALNLQSWIARKIADYLTAETGVTVVFESAIVPKWKDSRISFKNVFISRRAHTDAEALRRERRAKMRDEALRGQLPYKRVRRRTGITAGDGMSWEGTHYDEEEEVAPPMSDEARGEDLVEDDTVNTNFSMFDLQVDSIDVTLSLSRWFDGKGLIEDAVVKGVRGIVDRRNVFWDPAKPYDPRAARREARHGDFELESLLIEDFLVTIYQPNDFRPFNFSIFNARIPKLRKQWLFYDLLSAESITGQIDGCLFSLHKPQSIGRTVEKDKEMIHNKWKSMSRLRIDGVSFDHIQAQSELTGPVSWILSGKFDVVADIKFPRDFNDDMDINTIIAEILDNISAAVSGEAFKDEEEQDRPIPGQHRLSGPAIEAPVTTVGPTADRMRKENEEARRQGKPSRAATEGDHESQQGEDAETTEKREQKLAIPPPSVVIDMDVRFKDIKAAVPLFTNELSYKTNAFVRPIVAFMNANKTLIPVRCRIVVDLSEFDGSMDLAQTGLLPVVSDKIYEALANHVASENASTKRLRNVSLWSLQVTANAALNLVTLLRDTLVRSAATSPLVASKA